MAGECRSAEDRSVQARREDRSYGMGRGAHLPMGAATHQCRKPVGGCFGTTRSKPGRRCSKQAGGDAPRLSGETVLPLNLLQQPLVVDSISVESTITNSNASGQD